MAQAYRILHPRKPTEIDGCVSWANNRVDTRCEEYAWSSSFICRQTIRFLHHQQTSQTLKLTNDYDRPVEGIMIPSIILLHQVS